MLNSINQYISELSDRVTKELKTPVDIEDMEQFPPEDSIYSTKRTWKRIRDVVVVVVDLKGSTSLNFRKHAQTSARLYEAITGNCARIVERFDPDFVDIQGDGLFGLYHGERAFERAICAGITLKTFSERSVVPSIEENMSDRFPDTGLKVGMASGVLAVKKVGVRGTTEPVWAGKPVNWATKCAQKADANQLVATQSVYNKFEDNDYVTYSCGCPDGTAKRLWEDTAVEKLPEDQANCKLLKSNWCVHHGDEFCNAILGGQKHRTGMRV